MEGRINILVMGWICAATRTPRPARADTVFVIIEYHQNGRDSFDSRDLC
jgi:hypothetical protein